MRRSSTLLSRLAIALLAICGFVITPHVAREADGVVQTAHVRHDDERREEEPGDARAGARDVEALAPRAAPRQAPPTGARRYLLHRAWLI